MFRLIFIATICLLVGLPGHGLCEIYKWTNDDGSVGFSDNPTNIPEQHRSKVEIGSRRSHEEPGKGDAPSRKSRYDTATNGAIVDQGNENIKGFSAGQTKIIAAAMREWNGRYACGREVEVQPFEGSYRDLANGVREIVEETAGPGYMKINPTSRISLRKIVLHAMTHACQPDAPNILPRPIPLGSVTIIGYHGASVMVRLRDGQQTFFRKMEEGLCERNASFFPGYTISHRGYFAAGKLARQHFPEGRDTMALIRNNDVPGLIGIIVGKAEPSLADVQKVMNMYQEAWTDKK